ncbi:MAG: endonuclease/exonuclease/phosphatase family protein [Eggerthellaceae bacterium]|nr:endonuclease/exonuclease/phosphatase family protein [Eggerthellaceae bacterium]
MAEKKIGVAKKVAISVGALLAAIALIVGGYVAYVMLSYYRLDDSISIEADAPKDPAAELNYWIDLASDDGSSPELTVVASNLGFGAYGPDFDFFMDGGSGSVAKSAQYVEDNIKGTAEAIKGFDPDFLLFQEVDVAGTRSHDINEYELLRSEFSGDDSVFVQNYDSPYLAWPPYAPHGANKAGLATFSDCLIADTTRRSLPISEGFSKFLDLDRCYSISRIPTSSGVDLVLFNVHLSAYGADESIMKGQRDMLFADMQKARDAGNFVIAGGDFNHDMIGISNEVFDNKTDTEASWAKPFDFASVPAGFTVACKEQLDAGTFASAATCRDAGRPYDGANDRWVMDAFIYSDNVECLEQSTLDLDFAYSDHNPVYMRFRLK